MKSSRQLIPIFAAALLLAATAAQAAHVDMKDPRRSLGREDDIRVDAQLYQDTVSTSGPINVIYRIENLSPAPIAIADKVTAVSYDEDSRTITLSIGAEIPAETMPHLVVIAAGAKKTLTAGGICTVTVANARAAGAPSYVQVRVNVLRDLSAFSDLVAQSARTAAPVPIPSSLFDTWIDAVDTILCNSIPVHWSNSRPRGDTPSAEQRAPSLGTW